MNADREVAMRFGSALWLVPILSMALGCGNESRCSHCDTALERVQPGQPLVLSYGFGSVTVGVGGYDCLDACFHCDLDHRSDDGSVRWKSLDTIIATVSPEVSRTTTVTGIREGRTTVRATILGTTVDTTVIVVAPPGPPPNGCLGL